MARILVIDDDDMMRQFMRDVFTRAGFEVDEAADGKSGVEAYRSGGHDLVVTDLYMPEKDGVEVLQELRSEFPDVKLIAISGGGRVANLGVLQSLKDLGVHETFPKPVRPSELVDAAKRILSADGPSASLRTGSDDADKGKAQDGEAADGGRRE